MVGNRRSISSAGVGSTVPNPSGRNGSGRAPTGHVNARAAAGALTAGGATVGGATASGGAHPAATNADTTTTADTIADSTRSVHHARDVVRPQRQLPGNLRRWVSFVLSSVPFVDAACRDRVASRAPCLRPTAPATQTDQIAQLPSAQAPPSLDRTPDGVSSVSGFASAHAVSSTWRRAAAGWAPDTPYFSSTTKNGTPVMP